MAERLHVARAGAGVEAPAAASERPGGSEREVCPSCGEALAGDYCHACGEKRPEARDLSLRHFAQDAAQELTSLDSKLLRTVRALLFRPGFLTNEWIAGRRSAYLKPLNLCLAIFAVSLFVFTASKQVSMFNFGVLLDSTRQQAEELKIKEGDPFNRRLDAAAARRGTTKDALVDSINERWQRDFSLLQPAEIILLALLLQVVYIFSRRYFVEHLVFSMHFLAFTALTVTLMWPIYYLIGLRPSGFNIAVAASKFLLDIIYLFVALRAVYSSSSAAAVLRALVVFVGYFVVYITTYMVSLAAAAFPFYR